MLAMRQFVACSSKSRTLTFRRKRKEENPRDGPPNNFTNRYHSRVQRKKQNTRYVLKKKSTPIRDPTALLFNISYPLTCYNMTLCSLSSYLSNNSYPKYFATDPGKDTEDCLSQCVPVRTTCTRYFRESTTCTRTYYMYQVSGCD